MNMINIDGRHIIEQENHKRRDAVGRIFFFALAFMVVLGCAEAYDHNLRLPEKAVCADTVPATKADMKFSAYMVECQR